MEDKIIEYSTAKLAKEKGLTYDEVGQSFRPNGEFTYGKNDNIFYPAPTQGLLQKWLREKHNLYICISAEFYKTGINHTLQILCYNPNLSESDYYDNDKCTGMYGDNAEFNTYEEALEFGLQKALKLI